MKRVLSVSLGSSSRDKSVEVELLGQRFLVERRGTDGSLEAFRRLMLEADGQVDVLCVGGANLALHWRGRRYPLHSLEAVARQVNKTPVVDGSVVKDTLEREALRWVQREGLADLVHDRLLLVCGVDRFGMAAELREIGAQRVVLGDLMFDLGLPLALNFRAVDILAPLCLPLLGRMPFSWLYPTGSQQDKVRPKWQKWYEWADVILGDFLIIRRHLPERLEGKLLVTNSTTSTDLDLLRDRGVRALVTTSLRVEGRSFGTNVLEGLLTALAAPQKGKLSREECLHWARRVGWRPELIELG